MMRAGIEPGKTAAELLRGQSASLQIDPICVRDLKFAASRRLELTCDLDNRRVVKVQPRHRPIRFWLLRLFLNLSGQPAIVEFKNAVTSGVVDPMAEDGSAAAVVRGMLHEFT